MSSLVQRVGKDTVLYGLGTVIARVASVALLPVYTRYLTPANYGLLQLLELAAEVTSILFVAGSRAGMLRFYYRTESGDERKRVVSTAFLLEMALATAGALVLMTLASPVWEYALAGEGTPELVRLAALSFLLSTMHNAPLSYLQAKQRAAAFTGVLIGKLVLQVVFNLLFLVHLEMGVRGMMLSSVIANGTVGLGLGLWLISQTRVRPEWRILRDLRRYGVPYQVTTAGAFILTFGDRFFLQRFQGAAEVGLYALAYQFGFILFQLGASPFLKAWTPERYKRYEASPETRDAETRQGFLFMNLLLLSMATGISVASRPAIGFLTESSYHEAAVLVPVILAAYVLNAWVDAVKFGIDVSERTVYFTYASWIATVSVLIAYALLVPPFGGMGAAVATAIAFAIRFGFTLFWSQRLAPLDYGWARIMRLTLLSALTCAAGVLYAPDPLYLQVGAALLLFGGYAASTWRFILTVHERDRVLGMLRARLSQ